MLKQMDMLCILPLEGWQQSKGVADELAYAKEIRKPVMFWTKNGPSPRVANITQQNTHMRADLTISAGEVLSCTSHE